MNAASDRSAGLDAVRQKIDTLDDEMPRALGERFALVADVKRLKGLDAASGAAPAMRPAREAQILRRLLAANEGRVPEHTLVGIWCEIMAAATQLQAELRVHRPATAQALAYHDLVRRRFGSLAPIVEQPTAADVVAAVAAGRSDIGILPLGRSEGDDSDLTQASAAALLGNGSADIRVIAQLPLWRDDEAAGAWVIGKAPYQPSGDDATLIAWRGGGQSDAIDAVTVCHVAGVAWTVGRIGRYVDSDDDVVIGLADAADEVRVLGGHPAAIEFGTRDDE